MSDETQCYEDIKGAKPAPPPPLQDEIEILDRGSKPARKPPAPNGQGPIDSSPSDVDKMRPQKSV